MRTRLFIIALVSILFSCKRANDHPEKTDIDQLIGQMTLEEKVGQMTNLTLATIADDKEGDLILDTSKLRQFLVINHIGSFQNVVNHAYSLEKWHTLINTIQKMNLDESRLKIPFLYCIDAVHGTNYTIGSTIFPHNLNLAATRDPDITYEASRITAAETRASGIRYNFSPVLDVGRKVTWSRFAETFGEDVELVKVLGMRSIQGYEGTDLKEPSAVAACMKHFIGYSVPENGKDRAPAYIPEVVLREYFLPPFEAAIKAGTSTLMVNSGEINGVPVHASKHLLTDILRTELGFKGVVISDWEDVKKLHERHRVAATHKEAVLLAVQAGIDMCIVPFDLSFYHDLIALVKEGKIKESRIDESVKRILQLKKDLNLWEKPYVEEEAVENFARPEYKETALAAARASMVLLKNNDNLLPLSPKKKILITGPSATSLSALHGAWSYTWQGTKEDFFPEGTLNILEAFKKQNLDRPANVAYQQGAAFSDSVFIKTQEFAKKAAEADVIVICAGEGAYAETPGNIKDLDLASAQKDLIRTAAGTGKPIVLILTEGRPRIIREIEPLCKAIIFAGWPGSQGAQAIADVFYGHYNPDGRLPFTYPRWSNELLTYDHKQLDEAVEIVEPEYQYLYEFLPQYQFGHGLSYTTFEYSDIRFNKEEIGMQDSLIVTFSVKNTGNLPGKEVAELYIRDLYASITPSVKRLKKFQKIHLAPGEAKELTFKITVSDLSFINEKLQRITEAGDFAVIVKEKSKQFKLNE